MKRLLVLLAACGGDPAAADAGGDAITDVAADAPQCFGTIESYCFTAPPDGTLVITGVDATKCDPAFDDRCVITARDIVVSGFVSSGKRPLVLVAARSLQVDGIFTANGSTSAADCPALTTPGATGGGAGGTFATKAGSGANGGFDSGIAAANPLQLTTLRSGCNGNGLTGGGVGGGAIALVAGERIAVLPTALVGACGTAGSGGGAAAAPGAPGSGGGSGGMIELDAPMIEMHGNVFAIGGGGGGGSNDSVAGNNGGTACNTQKDSNPTGGLGNGGGGIGGTAGPGGNGAPGSNGGGGGGGAGAIWTHGVITGTGQIIPAPTVK